MCIYVYTDDNLFKNWSLSTGWSGVAEMHASSECTLQHRKILTPAHGPATPTWPILLENRSGKGLLWPFAEFGS